MEMVSDLAICLGRKAGPGEDRTRIKRGSLPGGSPFYSVTGGHSAVDHEPCHVSLAGENLGDGGGALTNAIWDFLDTFGGC